MKIEASDFEKFREERERLAIRAARIACRGFFNFLFPFRLGRIDRRIKALDRVLKGDK